ncbi:hypothetical protein [Kitasatospora sp. NPDC058190]|uniref:hypothetical protein n=1 Tax=Kitasatospora sp. NPDC058190 TaxID=3346371 RepID=UPI0036D84B6A
MTETGIRPLLRDQELVVVGIVEADGEQLQMHQEPQGSESFELTIGIMPLAVGADAVEPGPNGRPTGGR